MPIYEVQECALRKGKGKQLIVLNSGNSPNALFGGQAQIEFTPFVDEPSGLQNFWRAQLQIEHQTVLLFYLFKAH